MESAVERFLGAGLLTAALLSGKAVLAVLGAAALAGAMVWDVTFAGHAASVLLALAGLAALLG